MVDSHVDTVTGLRFKFLSSIRYWAKELFIGVSTAFRDAGTEVVDKEDAKKFSDGFENVGRQNNAEETKMA